MELGEVIVVALAWVAGLTPQRTRTRTFVLFAGIITLAWLAAALAAPPGPVRAVILGALVAVAIVPELFGARALTRQEASADTLYAEMGPQAAASVTERVESLETIRQAVPGDYRRLAATRLMLWALARQYDTDVPGSTVPTHYFERASIRLLRDAQWRRVLGWRPLVTAWDEDVALRGFHEEAKSLLPHDLRKEPTPVEVAPWVGWVRTLLGDLANVPLRDPITRETRAKLHDAIEALFVVSLGDRSDDAIRRQEVTAQAMRSAWVASAEHIESLRSEP